MWNLQKIQIDNLFSHEHSVYEFSDNVCTLIVGENKDTGGNNGAGKSTLFEAICIALTNKSLRDLKKENFINRDADSCKIILWLENKVLQQSLVISRQFYRGNKPVKVLLTENGELNSSITSVDEANKHVFELLGISREDLLRYFIISQDDVYTFFTAGDTEKKEVLNRITSADMINPLIEEVGKKKKDLIDKIYDCDNEKSKFLFAIQTLQTQKNSINNSDDTTKEKIKQFEGEIKKYEGEKKKYEKEIVEQQERIKALKKQFNSIKIVNTDELKRERKELREQNLAIESRIEENKKVQRIAKSDLNCVVECPSCGEEFITESELNLSVEETKTILSQVEEEIKECEKEQKDIASQIQSVRQKIEENERQEEKKQSIEYEIKKIQRNISSFQDSISIYNKKIEEYEAEIRDLAERKKNDVVLKNIDEKIASYESQITSVDQENINNHKEYEMYNFWDYYLGKSGFQTYLANKSLSVIEGTVNSFLKKFHSDLSVSINGFKVLKDGTVREKIDILALNDGMNAEAFLSKSGGERGRINLAGILAIQHLINMSTDGKGLNFLALDESLAYIDSEGTMEVVKTLNNMGITIMMITQNIDNDSKKMIANTLCVEKKNGVSSFIFQQSF